MWAVLNKKSQIVVGVLLPDATLEAYKEAEKDYDLIAMTLENSPATIGYIYKNNNFYPIDTKEGDANG
jgi:hypothetical protein